MARPAFSLLYLLTMYSYTSMHKIPKQVLTGLMVLASALICLLAAASCRIFDSASTDSPQPPVCDQALKVEAVSNDIQGTFYPNSKWEQAKDLLDPEGNYHKYGLKFRTSVHLSNPNEADLMVKRSVGRLLIKNENMKQKNYEAALPEFIVKAMGDTVVHFDFMVDIAGLSVDYFKLIAENEKVGYFFKSSHKYGFIETLLCSDTSLVAHQSNASDTTIQDYVSIPEVVDGAYQGTQAAVEASATSAKWTIDNWDAIQCTVMILVLILGIFLGGHAGQNIC
jgi:hypothetical protein